MPLGETIGRAYVRILADGTGFDEDVRRELRKNKGSFEKAGGEHAQSYNKGFEDEVRRRPLLKDLKESLAKGKGEFHATGVTLGGSMMQGLEESLKKEFPGAGRDIFKGLKKDLTSGKLAFEDLGAELEDLRPRWHRAVEDLRGGSRKMGRDLDGVQGSLHRFATGMGKVFGKGSRNDFLNFFGSFVSAIPSAIASLAGIGDTIKGLADKFQLFRAQGGGVASVLGALGKGAAGLVGVAAAVVVLGEALALALGPLGAAVSLLAGLILSLAGAIGFALAGALIAVGGALIPFAAGIGVIAIAFGKLNKKSRVFKDLKKDWEDLQKSVQKKVFGKDLGGLTAFGAVLKGIKPILDAAASSVGGLLLYFGEAARSTGFQTLMQSIASAIGPMVTTIGQIGGNIAKFLGEAFVAASPMIEEFLGWVLGLTQAMVAATRPLPGGGQSPLVTFLKGAWESAKKVGGFVLQVIGLVGDLLGMGKVTGDNIFVKLTGWVEKLRTWLSDPKNSKQIEQWFLDAEKLGDKIGEVVLAVIGLVRKLDTPSNRRMLFAILDVLTWIIDKFGDVMTKVDELNTKMLIAGGALALFFADAKTGAESVDFGATGEDWKNQLTSPFALLREDISTQLSGLASTVFSKAGDAKAAFDLWWSGVTQGMAQTIINIVSPFQGLGTKIITAAGTLSLQFATWLSGLPVQIITVVGQIVTGFAGLAGKIIIASGDIIGRFTQWLVDLPGRSAQAVANIMAAFTNLALKIILAAGNLAVRFATWVSTLPGKARQLATNVVNGMLNLATRMIVAAGNLAGRFASWIASLPGKARTLAINIVNGMSNLAGRMISRAGDIAGRFAAWVRSLPTKARQIAADIANAFSGLASKAMAKAGSIVAAFSHWASGVYAAAKGVARDIVSAFTGLASDIVQAIGTIIPKISMPHINIPHITAIVDTPKAAGGIVDGARMALIGEAGPEAIVPLSRPLSQVDPAVRMLSAIAQGKLPGLARGGIAGGKSIDVGGITINTPTEDPRAVASEVVAHMAAATYI